MSPSEPRREIRSHRAILFPAFIFLANSVTHRAASKLEEGGAVGGVSPVVKQPTARNEIKIRI